MSERGVRMSVIVAACVLATGACGDDGGDGDGGGAGTAASSGGGAGASGSSGAGGAAGGAGTAGSSGGGAGASGSSGAGGAAGGAGNAGSSGAAGQDPGDEDAGTDPTAGTGGDDPGEDPATASATFSGFAGGSVTGTAFFTEDGSDVIVVIQLADCPDGAHAIHIHEGTSCESETAQGMHWGPTRGEGIPDVVCADDEGTGTHTRGPTPPTTAWSIGGDASSDIVGHAMVVHAAGSNARIGCGVITAN